MTALRKYLVGGAMALTLGALLIAPQPAAADWHHGGWHAGGGWHGGWGWRGGVWVGGPAVIVGAPRFYGPGYYGARYYGPGYRWVPPHYTPYGAFIPGHWGY